MSVARAAQPATPRAPATPAAQTDASHTPNGTWRHPKFDEIARRQYATTFDESNVRAIVANAGLLFLSLYGNDITANLSWLGYVATPVNAVVKAVPYSYWAIFLIRLVFIANVAYALAPLVRRYYPDDIADIPLTPSQRASMGLKAGTPTPAADFTSPNYVTPPRYQRSTPRSGSFSNHAENSSQSPMTGSPRAALGRSTSNSPFSPNNTGSPLFQRALNASQRLSYGGSPMSSSLFGDSSSSAAPGTPTPATGKASVGLNNKWLYEKRRDSPKSSLFT
ncbi:hypothetical protein ACN47E_008142 [Coniothyrium glycines]